MWAIGRFLRTVFYYKVVKNGQVGLHAIAQGEAPTDTKEMIKPV